MSHPDFPPFMIDEMPLEKALEILEFIRAPSGFTRKWDDLEFSAGESFDCWFLMRGGFCTKRTATPPHDVRILSPIAPIKLMASIYELWVEVFGVHAFDKIKHIDPFLLWGKEWIDYQRELKMLIPRPPTIWAEREFLRHCFNYIEQKYDWIDHDYNIIFSQVRGQLRIMANDLELYCPARGYLLGETSVSAKSLYRNLPKRFIGNVVMLQYDKGKLAIDNREFPAGWKEETIEETK